MATPGLVMTRPGVALTVREIPSQHIQRHHVADMPLRRAFAEKLNELCDGVWRTTVSYWERSEPASWRCRFPGEPRSEPGGWGAN